MALSNLMKLLPKLLPTMILLSSCAKAPGEEGSEVEAARTQCVYMEVLPSAPPGGVASYVDEEKSALAGYVGPNIPVVRQLTKNNKSGESMMRARVGYGSMTGQTVWLPSAQLRVRPGYGGCNTNLSNSGSYSLDRDGGFVRSGVMCFVGLGSGVVESAGGILSTAWNAAGAVVSRNIDAVKMLAGDNEAYKRLVQAGANDEKTASALIGLATNAIPALHIYIAGKYSFYKDLAPAQQSEMLCQVLGALSLDTLLAAATVGTANAAKTVGQGSAIVIRDASVPAKIAREMAKKSDDIGAAVSKAKTKTGSGTTRALSQGALSASEKVTLEVKEIASKVLRRCGKMPEEQPLSCLGLKPGASLSEIKSAYRKASLETAEDQIQGRLAEVGASYSPEIKKSVEEAQKALNTAYEQVGRYK